MIERNIVVDLIIMLFNVFLTFIVLTLLIEGFFFLFRVKNFRARALCRLIPILKLPFDLLLFAACGKNILINLNPFECKQYLTRFMSSYVPPCCIKTTLSIVLLIALCVTYRKLVQFVRSVRFLNHVSQKADPCMRQIRIKNVDTIIVQTDALSSPCAFGVRHIFIPKALIQQLSQEEFEAVIAHELEHLRWFDPTLKVLTSLISHAFWWIPTKWWLKKLEEEQEYACDAHAMHYGVERLALANALVKALRTVKGGEQATLAPGFSSRNLAGVHRIQKILDERCVAGQLCSFVLIGAVSGAIPILSFWIC